MTSDEDPDDEEYGVQCASVKNNVATRANAIGHLRARLREKLVLFWHWLASYVHCKTPGVGVCRLFFTTIDNVETGWRNMSHESSMHGDMLR